MMSFFFLLTSSAFAQGVGEYQIPSGLPQADGDIAGLLGNITDAVLPIAVIIAVAMLTISGIQYALAAGEEEKQARAKRTIKWTLFGLFIALVAYAIVALVISVVG